MFLKHVSLQHCHRCKSPRRVNWDRCLPPFQCFNSAKHLRCFRDDQCCPKPRRVPQRRRPCSRSPFRGKSPSKASRRIPSRENRGLNPTRNCPPNRCIVPSGEDSLDEKGDYCNDCDKEFGMKVPENCEDHLLYHMRDNCLACKDCISKWRKAIEQDYKATLTTAKTRTKRNVCARRSSSPELPKRKPCAEKKACREYRRRSKPRSRSCGSYSCRRKSPRVSWWFGGGQCTPPKTTDEQIDDFARSHVSRAHDIPERDVRLPHKGEPSHDHDFDEVSEIRDDTDRFITTMDRFQGGLTHSSHRSEKTVRFECENSTYPEYEAQSTLPIRSKISKFAQQDHADQDDGRRENRPRCPNSGCKTCPSKFLQEVTQSSPVSKHDRFQFRRKNGEHPRPTDPLNATFTVDSEFNARHDATSNKIHKSIGTGATTPNWRHNPSCCPRYPECRPFCPSEAVLTTKRPNTKNEWADRHACLMLECNSEKYATAKERTRRLLNKSKELKESMSNMCLDFGDLEQRLEKVFVYMISLCQFCSDLNLYLSVTMRITKRFMRGKY